MREIKFRVWLSHLKEFEPTRNCGDALNAGYPIMQYTGLKDKNGKEIYQGDIVHGTTLFSLNNFDFIREVKFDQGMFGISDPYEANEYLNKLCHWVVFEVIGNIYENPELLESK